MVSCMEKVPFLAGNPVPLFPCDEPQWWTRWRATPSRVIFPFPGIGRPCRSGDRNRRTSTWYADTHKEQTSSYTWKTLWISMALSWFNLSELNLINNQYKEINRSEWNLLSIQLSFFHKLTEVVLLLLHPVPLLSTLLFHPFPYIVFVYIFSLRSNQPEDNDEQSNVKTSEKCFLLSLEVRSR